MIAFTLNGKSVSVPEGATVLDAARAAGIDIPTLCHIEGLEGYGGCRVCMVEVEGSRTGCAPACTLRAAEGMVVRTDSEAAFELRKAVLEMILAEHPADCFNCKHSGACRLHELAARHGLEKVPSGIERSGFPVDDSNPFFTLDPNRCILCGKCVRTCAEIQCSDVYTFADRGCRSSVVPGFGDLLSDSRCVSCGSCVAACPTGALRPKDGSWAGAMYVDRRVRTVCSYCGVGCQLELLVSGGRVVGVVPADEPSNRGRLCVKGRFAYNFIGHPDRLTVPLVRRDGALVEASWDEALDLVAGRLRSTLDRLGPDGVAGLASARCTNEENYLFQKLFRAGGGTNNVDHCARLCHASTVAGLAATLGSGAMTNSIDEIDIQDAIFVTGSNTTETHPVIGTRIYAGARAAGIYYAMGVTQHAAGTEGVMALSNLALACGKLGKAGCGINPLRGQNNVQGACDVGALPDVLPGYRKVSDPAARAAAAAVWGREPPAEPGLTVTEMIRAAESGHIGFLYIMGENPLVSDPDIGLVREALTAAEFLVVQDIFLTETAALADVVLPSACFAEKDGTFTNTERRVQRVRKAVPPPGRAREDLDILAELLARMGLPQADRTGAGVFAEMARLAPQYAGMSWDRLENGGLQWPCPAPDHPGTPILHAGRFTRGPGRFIPYRWLPPAEEPDAEFPLVLTTGRNLYQYHTRTMTGWEHGLTILAGEAYAELHPHAADRAGVAHGGLMRLSTRRGSIELTARVSEGIRPDTVFVPFHYAEAAANILTGTALDPHAKIPELKVCAVRAEAGNGRAPA